MHTAHGAERTVAKHLESSVEGEVFLPERHTEGGEPPDLLFTNYVFVRTDLTDDQYSAILRHEHVRSLVGSAPGTASPIPDWEIRFLKQMASMARHPLLGETPTTGAEVEVATGALAGARGRVLSVHNQNARLSVSVSYVGKTFEIIVPLADLANLSSAVSGERHAEERKKKKRGGKRMRRTKQQPESG